VTTQRPLLIAYHSDFGRFFSFAKQSKLGEVAESLGLDWVFPQGGWFRAWRDKDVRGEPSFELADFDMLTRDREVVLAGYSDGAGLANYLASYRSHKVIAVISYAGRLQRDSIETTRKYPVFDLWNEFDKKEHSQQHRDMESVYDRALHEVFGKVLPNKKTHYHGWDSDVNDQVIDFIETAMAA